MAIKKAIIHLGMPKTGSSSIQHTLFNNSAVLEKNGFKYLTEWGLNHLDIFHNLFSPYPFKNNWTVSTKGLEDFGKPISEKKRQQKTSYFIEKMQNAIKTSNCETLILSGEFFRNLWLDSTLGNIKDFVTKYFHSNGIETTFIFLTRNPLAWIISFFNGGFFKTGYIYNEIDYVETRIKQYESIINFQNHFSDSTKLFKFEDAIVDKDGLVGYFLKVLNFPQEELENIKTYRVNEAKCLEVMEFNFFIETIEPRFLYGNYRRKNPYRYDTDLKCLRDIKGIKFDFSCQSKVELWERLQKTVHLFKENTNIDYTCYKIPPPAPEQETYSEETIQGFIAAFPKLSYVLQKHFLKFFEKKYTETAQLKFRQLYLKDNISQKMFKSKSAFISLVGLRISNKIYRAKKSIRENIPPSIKPTLKRILRSKQP